MCVLRDAVQWAAPQDDGLPLCHPTAPVMARSAAGASRTTQIIGASLQQTLDRRLVAGDRGEVLGRRLAGDALVVGAGVGRMDGGVGDAGVLPELDFLAPLVGAAGARRDPDFEPEIVWVAAIFAQEAAQF